MSNNLNKNLKIKPKKGRESVKTRLVPGGYEKSFIANIGIEKSSLI